jgi:hypothetical protein
MARNDKPEKRSHESDGHDRPQGLHVHQTVQPFITKAFDSMQAFL